jgi:CheY-like chemotaxis protein
LDFGGYCALEAASGEEALRVATEYDGPIDVLLTDLLMPSMDGRELADRMRTLRPDIRILFMSGNPGDENAAGDGPRCILKPFREAALARAIRETLTAPPSPRLRRGAGA